MFRVIKCTTKLQSHLLETSLSTRNTLLNYEKSSLPFPDDFFDEYTIKHHLLFHRRKKKTATPIKTRNKIPPITPPTIAPVFDFFPLGGAKTIYEHIRNIIATAVND